LFEQLLIEETDSSNMNQSGSMRMFDYKNINQKIYIVDDEFLDQPPE
jgi:hypothetical protein